MEKSDKEFKAEFKELLSKWCWDDGSSGAEKVMEGILIKDFFNKMDKHQKRKVKMLCEIFKHKPSTGC